MARIKPHPAEQKAFEKRGYAGSSIPMYNKNAVGHRIGISQIGVNRWNDLSSRRLVMQYKIPLVLSPQPEGGYTVTSPLIPEFLTEGDTVDDALYNVRDALAAAIEIYQDTGRDFPPRRAAEWYLR